MAKRVLFFFILLIFSITAWSKEIHVSVLAQPGDDGSEASPYMTIQAAAAVANPGDEVVIHAGICRETVIPAKSGTASTRITYRPFNEDLEIIDATGLVVKIGKQ